jgi:chromosome segregation ATPase
VKRWVCWAALALVALLLVGCKPTVPQEEYDLVVAELATAEAEIARLEGQVSEAEDKTAEVEGQLAEAQAQINDLQQELDDFQSQETDAESELRELREKADRAVLAADILDVIVRAVLGAEEISEEEAVQLFLELSSRVEESGDPVLQEKFQAVLLSFGGQEEGIDLVQYLIEMVAELEE